MDEIMKRDANRVTVIGGVTDDDSLDITQVRINPITKRLKVDIPVLDGAIDSILSNEWGISGYDRKEFGYTGSNLTTIVYKNGSTVVNTLTLSYDGANNLTGITKT